MVASEPWLRKPMNMQFDHTGRLWITESREYPYPSKEAAPRDTIRIFSQFDENGRAGKMTVFATNLNIPIGLYPFLSPSPQTGKMTWKCIAWSIPNIYLFEDTDGDDKADQQTILYGPFDATRDTHGNQSSFRRGFDGWLYAHHGFNNDSHVTARDGSHVDMNSGNSYRIRLDGSRIEHHTHGQVNPFGMAFDEWGNIYSSDCHSAPTYQLLWGGYYPSFGKPHDGLGFAPVLMEHSHGSTAIDAMLYYSDDLWPEEFKDNIFVGNVMTSRVNRDRLAFNGSSPRAIELDDFVKTTDPWFRPVDNLLAPDGALYIADFYNRIIGHYEVPLAHPGRDRERGRILRVVYKGQDGKAKLRPRALQTGLPGLIDELRSPSLARRMLAMNAITDQFGNTAREPVRSAVTAALDAKSKDATADRLVAHGIWLLWRLGVLEDALLTRAATDAGPLTRIHALRLITERGHQAGNRATAMAGVPGEFKQLVTSSLSHSNALVQRCAAEVLGKWTAAANVRPLVELRLRTPEADTHLIYVTRKSLRDHLANADLFQQVLGQKWSDAEARVLADVCPAITNSVAASFLLTHLQKVNEPRDTTAAYLKQAARYLPEAQIDDLATFVREKFAEDVDFQWALFKPIIEGLAQRGVAPGFRMKVWGDTLADGLLSSVRRNDSDWISIPIESNASSPNPWVVQRRPCSDGTSADLLCSLPQGETLTGILRSKSFIAPATLTFWMAGHDGFPDKPLQEKNYVRLRDGESHDVLFTARAPRHDTASKITWDLGRNAGQQVYLELVDGDAAGAYAWLAAGGFDPAVVALPRVTPKLIDERMQAVAQIAIAVNDTSLEPQLVEALKVPAGPDTRASLAISLLKLNPQKHLAICSDFVKDGSAPLASRQKIAQAMSDANLDEARTALADAVRFAPERNQPKLAVLLAANKTGAEVLLHEVEAGKLSARLLQDRTVKEKVMASRATDAASRISKLTGNLSPLNAELQRMIEQRRTLLSPGKASAARGSAVFEKACGVCHQIDGKGAVVGPQLDGIGARGVERILEDVIDPNRNVDVAFRTTIFVLQDDDVVSGLFRREEGAQIVYADTTGKEITLARKDVKERRPSELSLMPEGLAEGISPEDFNDLVAYLLTKSGARK